MEVQKQMTGPKAQQSNPPSPLEFSADELADVLKHASSIQAMKQNSGRELTTLEGAVETARELGISEESVREAAEQMRRRKERFTRLQRISRNRRNSLLRMIVTTAGVVSFIAFVSGMNGARAVLFGMSIAIVVLAGRWGRAILAQRYPDVFDAPAPGECRICGERARDRKATLCEEHRLLDGSQTAPGDERR